MAGPRILVVDDNAELLTLLSSSFEEWGYEVHTATRGRAALELARKAKPDLVVLDVLLPDLMGYDVAEGLKRLRIPFIFMSGVHKGGKSAANATGKYGALAYFEKPFERRALLDEVRKRLPVIPPPPQFTAFDVEAAPQVSETEPEIPLTNRVPVIGAAGRTTLKGGGPIQLKPVDPDLAERLSSHEQTSPQRVASRNVVEVPPIEEPPRAVPVAPEDLRPLETEGVRRGELKDNLPQLLAAFYAAKETGELGLSKGQVKKVVYFEAGMPVFALSNLVADRFGQFLVRAGKIPEGTLKSAADEAARTGQRTGDVLILHGELGEEERLYYVAQQIKSILYSLFAWEEGSYQLAFRHRAQNEAIKLDIHPANLIMRGIKKLYKAPRLHRLLSMDARPLPSQEPLFNLTDVELQPWEAHLLPRCDGSRTVRQLVQLSGKAENEALASLVAMTALRVLDAK
ncbi:MAG: response regulator [Myxococcales bacterium]